MNLQQLTKALGQMKLELERAITTASFGGKRCTNGHEAKQALIRSSRLIVQIHEVVKQDLDQALASRGVPYKMHPALGRSSPELHVTGFIKKKKQDVVALVGNTQIRREIVDDGPLEGTEDALGRQASATAIVVSVRSQLSSVDKNFDTLMERAFAETLNLRLRMPELVMGEIYLLPIYEYDAEAMKKNQVVFGNKPVALEKFIRTFIGISGRRPSETGELYKYERSALILGDFRKNPPMIYATPADLVQLGVDSALANMYQGLTPQGFGDDIVSNHLQRHS